MNMETFVKDFSGTTWPRILKFGTYFKYDRLYFVVKNKPHMAYQSLYLYIFLSFQQFFHLISSAPMSPTVFKFCIHDEDNQMYYCKHNQGSENNFCLVFFLFFPFPFSHSKVINMETFVKDFSGSTWPRILKFGTYKFDRLYCVLHRNIHLTLTLKSLCMITLKRDDEVLINKRHRTFPATYGSLAIIDLFSVISF